MTTPTENTPRDLVTREDVDEYPIHCNYPNENLGDQLKTLGHLLIDIRERLESIEKAVRESKR